MPHSPKLDLLIERHCAKIALTVAAGLCLLLWGRWPFPANWKEFLGAVFTASATGAGFLFTAASILLSMDERKVIRWGRETGAYQMFAGYLTNGVWWCLVAALNTLLMFLFDFTKSARWHRPVFALWVGLSVGAAIAVVRVLLILATILQRAAREGE
jgi:hypothetical protein